MTPEQRARINAVAMEGTGKVANRITLAWWVLTLAMIVPMLIAYLNLPWYFVSPASALYGALLAHQLKRVGKFALYCGVDIMAEAQGRPGATSDEGR